MPAPPGPPLRTPAGSHPPRGVDDWGDDARARERIGPRRAHHGHRSPQGPRDRWSPARRYRLRRTLLIATAAMAVLTLVAATLVYRHLNGNLRSLPLFSGTAGNAGTEKADPFGHTPLNILLIGSDTRSSAADCHLGGGCANGGAGANADVEMVVHLSADRSNATVLSIPRDTVTELPACRASQGSAAARTGQINSTLAYGPGCTVAAVHQLTGIPIDHFVMVDFAGVVAMSDAAGGAQVCVSANVYDTYSQLKLAKGTHTLKGLAALEFVRSRHAFGDGSDLGRTYAQHLFLSSVIRNLKSAGTLANPATLYTLADTATKALTVDTGLASIPHLIGLAADLDKVPTDRITFTTMPNQPDAADAARVVPAPSAGALFSAITQDRPLTQAKVGTAPSAAPSTAPSPAAPPASVTPSQVTVRVDNGSGRTGRAATIAAYLTARGFARAGYSGAPTTATTVLRYGPGQQAQARAVATALHLPDSLLQQAGTAGVVLVIGQDWQAGIAYPASAAVPAPATPAPGTPAPVSTSALQEAHAQTADQSGTCAPVSTQVTVDLNGVPMTPSRAFAVSTDVPVSAP
jgi:LCP family protein required for cell wall assembly